ncbi:MAG: cob(I)yrinic acid a,c-diamide adenosyltransferase [Cytophagales bacterium]|nr:cob(I)yrinic acid a,c-diamide adenosyltransferase [Cytophagales bacterium]
MKIYTKGGDQGKTGVVGGKRVLKSDIRMECLGDIDELNAYIGLLRVKLPEGDLWDSRLLRLQTDLMNLMAHVATPSSVESRSSVEKPVESSRFCENWIDEEEAKFDEESSYFLVPGGNEVVAHCHVARTVARRAERHLVALNQEDYLEDYVLRFMNRLSDLFFVLGRAEMHRSKVKEYRWRPFLSGK